MEKKAYAHFEHLGHYILYLFYVALIYGHILWISVSFVNFSQLE